MPNDMPDIYELAQRVEKVAPELPVGFNPDSIPCLWILGEGVYSAGIRETRSAELRLWMVLDAWLRMSGYQTTGKSLSELVSLLEHAKAQKGDDAQC